MRDTIRRPDPRLDSPIAKGMRQMRVLLAAEACKLEWALVCCRGSSLSLTFREVTDVPLCIDSANPKVLEAGLEAYEGKALINSVNGEQKKMEQVLPLAKAYGAAVIGLTSDDSGIPQDAPKRVDIAAKILENAQKLGVPAEDVIIDPLAMAVSTDDKAALQTLRAFQLIREKFGVNQTLGVSNISFGLPDRSAINVVFLAMAVHNGLTCPIVDPTNWATRKAILIIDLLLSKDEFCMNYITVQRQKFPDL